MRKLVPRIKDLRSYPPVYGPPAMPKPIMVQDEASVTPIEPSRTPRTFSMTSTSSHRGSVVDARTEREHVYESRLEERHLVVAMASKEVETIDEQVPTTFVDETGQERRYFIDSLYGLRDGRRVMVGVKPARRVEESGIFGVHRRVAERHGTKLADAMIVRTEASIHSDDVADARTILYARRMPNPAADEAVRGIAETLIGWSQLRDVAMVVAEGGTGFCAVVRAIDDDVLEVRDHSRISLDCFVRRSAV